MEKLYKIDSEVLLCGDDGLFDKDDMNIIGGIFHEIKDIVAIELNLGNTDFSGGIGYLSFGINKN